MLDTHALSNPDVADMPDGQIDVVVVGAGVAGLTVARELSRNGHDVRVYESSPMTGGVINSIRKDGFLIDCGPNTMLDKHPEVSSLVEGLDLLEERVFQKSASATRYIVRDGKLIALPSSPAAFILSPLFSLRAKLRLLREPFIPRGNGTESDESVAEFTVRRLGREFLDYAMDPFVGGIHAGRPDRLVVRHAFPKLVQLEKEHGSLIKGQFHAARKRKHRGNAPMSSGRIYSFRNGVKSLSNALARSVSEHIYTSNRIIDISPSKQGYRVESESGMIHARSVVYAAGLRDSKPLKSLFSGTGEGFSSLRYPPISVVALGYRRSQIKHPLDGSGMLIPSIEDRFILGTLFSSSIFPGRAPAGHELLTSFVGGDRQPELTEETESRIVDVVHTELSDLLGIHEKPVFQHVATLPMAIPQFDSLYSAAQQDMDRLENDHAGFFFCGNTRAGLSLPDTMLHALKLAGRVGTFLESPHVHVDTL